MFKIVNILSSGCEDASCQGFAGNAETFSSIIKICNYEVRTEKTQF